MQEAADESGVLPIVFQKTGSERGRPVCGIAWDREVYES